MRKKEDPGPIHLVTIHVILGRKDLVNSSQNTCDFQSKTALSWDIRYLNRVRTFALFAISVNINSLYLIFAGYMKNFCPLIICRILEYEAHSENAALLASITR